MVHKRRKKEPVKSGGFCKKNRLKPDKNQKTSKICLRQKKI